MKRILVAALALLAGTVALRPAGAGDCGSEARKILEKVSKTYAGLSRYDISVDVDLPKRAMGLPVPVTMQVRLAGEKPSRLRVELRASPQPGIDFHALSVSDGDSTWTLLAIRPVLNQYTCQPAASLGPNGGGILGSSGDLFTRYVDLAEKAFAPCKTGEESIPFMGKPVKCDVVVLGEKRRLPTAPGDSARVTLWIDKKTSLVLKEVAAVDSVEMKSSMVKAAFEGPLPESLFVFSPPPDARRVSEFAASNAAREPSLAGREASDFTLNDLDGRSVRLSDLRGKVVLLDFWATWCGPCRRELPVVRTIRSEFGEDDLVVLAVNVREKPETIASFVSKNAPFGLTVVLDATGEVSRAYSVTGIPTVVVIGRDGTIVWSQTGVASGDAIREAVKQAQAKEER